MLRGGPNYKKIEKAQGSIDSPHQSGPKGEDIKPLPLVNEFPLDNTGSNSYNEPYSPAYNITPK